MQGARWMLAAVLVAVGLCASVVVGEDAPPRTAPKISAPDVDPLSGKYTESVRVIMVQNAQQAQVYYRVDTDASTPVTVNSSRYTRPFYIYTAGVVYLRAVAISDVAGRPDSEVTMRRYEIQEGTKVLPVISPTDSMYRGGVNVTINADGAPVEYRTDMDDHYSRYTAPFALDVAGHHTVYARRVAAEGKEASSETTVTRVYTITPPLRFDASSSCDECNHVPTRCVPFTVWLQGLERPGRMFLTTSQLGCERRTHVLVDTAEVDVDPMTAGYRFSTADDPTDVFVCLQESTDGPFVRVAGRSSGKGSFRLTEAPESRRCQTLPPQTPAPRATIPADANVNYGNGDANNFMSIGNVFFWTLVICLAFVIMRAHRARMSNAQEWQRPGAATRRPESS